MKVALVSGFWAQNIGNAFFNIGGNWALQQAFGSDQVQFIQDQPAYRTFYNKKKGEPINYACLHEILDVEFIVLQGPMLTETFRSIWCKAFKVFKEKNVKVILLGAAFFKYNNKELNAVKSFLKEYPPYLISTRDSISYNAICDIGIPCFDGLDSAFFVPKAFSPLTFSKPYMTFNFDRFPEPNISVRNSQSTCGHLGNGFSFDDHDWHIDIPPLQSYLSHKGKACAYLGHLLDIRKLPSELMGHMLIRPEHRYTPHMTHKIYQHPNSFVSDEVYTYLSVYAGTHLTLADRVHACVMTLAYGNPAMLFTPSPRQALFSRVGADDIRKKPVTICMDELDEIRTGVVDFLSSHCS